MHMKALERLISERGVDASKADTITRRLRESGKLPSGGRGANAPQIGAREAAIFLIAVAGSPKAIDAPTRVDKLSKLRSDGGGPTFLDAVEGLLADQNARQNVREVRIARTHRGAVIISDERTDTYRPTSKKQRSGRLSVEGILDRELISDVALALIAPSTARADAAHG
jgi:hypothetical protein